MDAMSQALGTDLGVYAIITIYVGLALCIVIAWRSAKSRKKKD